MASSDRPTTPGPAYYTVVLEIDGTRVYTDPYTFEGDAERKSDELAALEATDNVHVIGHDGSVGGE